MRRLVWVLPLVLGACVALPRENAPASTIVRAPASYPTRIAILPVLNHSGSSDGAALLRGFTVELLRRDYGYLIQEPNETDQAIQARSPNDEIPLSVKTSRLDPAKLATWMGVDGVIQPELVEYSKGNLLLYEEAKVKVRFKLLDQNGKVLWEGENSSSSSGLGTGGTTADVYMTDMPADLAARARQSPLSGALFEVTRDALVPFPHRN